MHLDLRLLMFQKIMKKSMSISLGTCDKTEGARYLANRCGCRENEILVIVLNITMVFKRWTLSGIPTGTEPHEER